MDKQIAEDLRSLYVAAEDHIRCSLLDEGNDGVTDYDRRSWEHSFLQALADYDTKGAPETHAEITPWSTAQAVQSLIERTSAAEACVRELHRSLRTIAELTTRRQLPLTAQINDIACAVIQSVQKKESMLTDEQKVKKEYPDATACPYRDLDGFHVEITDWSEYSEDGDENDIILGRGDDEEQAWADAARRMDADGKGR